MNTILKLTLDGSNNFYGVVVNELQAENIQNTLDCCTIEYRGSKIAVLNTFLEYKGICPTSVGEGIDGPTLYYNRLTYDQIRTLRKIVGKNFKIEDTPIGGICVITNINGED